MSFGCAWQALLQRWKAEGIRECAWQALCQFWKEESIPAVGVLGGLFLDASWEDRGRSSVSMKGPLIALEGRVHSLVCLEGTPWPTVLEDRGHSSVFLAGSSWTTMLEGGGHS